MRLEAGDLLLGNRRYQRRDQLAGPWKPQTRESAHEFVDQRMVRDQCGRVVQQPGQARRRRESKFRAGTPRLGDDGPGPCSGLGPNPRIGGRVG